MSDRLAPVGTPRQMLDRLDPVGTPHQITDRLAPVGTSRQIPDRLDPLALPSYRRGEGEVIGGGHEGNQSPAGIATPSYLPL